jgi:glycosyltransferase involved in cell wall biosynthesis
LSEGTTTKSGDDISNALQLLGTGVRIGVDWFEVWSLAYWSDYLGAVGGRIGWLVQAACARLTPLALTYAERHGARLRRLRRGAEERVAGFGVTADLLVPTRAAAEPPHVLFLGRHTADKQVAAIPAALATARAALPGLRGVLTGDGPSRAAVVAEVGRLGLDDAVDLPGFVDDEAMAELLAGAACLVLPSRREGFGLVVLEAAGAGVPSVVVDGPDNAAADLVEEGRNGTLAGEATAAALGGAIVRAVQGGPSLRASSRAWAEAVVAAATTSPERAVLAAYERDLSR